MISNAHFSQILILVSANDKSKSEGSPLSMLTTFVSKAVHLTMFIKRLKGVPEDLYQSPISSKFS